MPEDRKGSEVQQMRESIDEDERRDGRDDGDRDTDVWQRRQKTRAGNGRQQQPFFRYSIPDLISFFLSMCFLLPLPSNFAVPRLSVVAVPPGTALLACGSDFHQRSNADDDDNNNDDDDAMTGDPICLSVSDEIGCFHTIVFDYFFFEPKNTLSVSRTGDRSKHRCSLFARVSRFPLATSCPPSRLPKFMPSSRCRCRERKQKHRSTHD